jgi:hypothetical protein
MHTHPPTAHVHIMSMEAVTIGSRSIFFPLSLAFGSAGNQPKIAQISKPTPGPGQLLVKIEWFAAVRPLLQDPTDDRTQ